MCLSDFCTKKAFFSTLSLKLSQDIYTYSFLDITAFDFCRKTIIVPFEWFLSIKRFFSRNFKLDFSKTLPKHISLFSLENYRSLIFLKSLLLCWNDFTITNWCFWFFRETFHHIYLKLYQYIYVYALLIITGFEFWMIFDF